VYVPEYHKDGITGGNLRRFSCRVCISSTDADLRAIRERDREAFNLVSNFGTKDRLHDAPDGQFGADRGSQVSTPVETERQQRSRFCL
jgi:hypothetical protein